MTEGLKVKRQFHVRRGRKNRRDVVPGSEPAPPAGRVPRVARLMALAIRFDQLLRGGVVADQSELSRLGLVSRARVTQIMNLLNLAPDIQEELLHLPPAVDGREWPTERQLRAIVALANWSQQRRRWKPADQQYA